MDEEYQTTNIYNPNDNKTNTSGIMLRLLP
jgi:hypothetical protein